MSNHFKVNKDMATKLKTLPAGHKIIETAHGNYIQKQKKRKRTYKMPKAQRQKIAAAARRFKFPILTGAAVGLPIIISVDKAGGMSNLFTRSGMFKFSREMLASYTGVFIEGGGGVAFVPHLMLRGLVPIAIVAAVNRLGLLKTANQKLAKTRLPLRLS